MLCDVVKTELTILKSLVARDLSITEPIDIFSKRENLQMWLTGEIRILLDHDFNRLLNILYRMDVSEEKVNKAFAEGDPAFAIAGLIIERELKKVETRSKYSDPD